MIQTWAQLTGLAPAQSMKLLIAVAGLAAFGGLACGTPSTLASPSETAAVGATTRPTVTLAQIPKIPPTPITYALVPTQSPQPLPERTPNPVIVIATPTPTHVPRPTPVPTHTPTPAPPPHANSQSHTDSATRPAYYPDVSRHAGIANHFTHAWTHTQP